MYLSISSHEISTVKSEERINKKNLSNLIIVHNLNKHKCKKKKTFTSSEY